MPDEDTLARGPREPEHRAALLCVPHAGAGASSLHAFHEAAPRWLRTGIVRFPGRETRFAIRAPDGPEGYVAEVVAAATTLADGLPLAVLGHCSGVSLALAALPGIVRAGVRTFAGVSVSGPAPDTSAIPMDPDATDEELVAGLVAAGDPASAVFEDGEMAELLLPQIRADFVALATLPRSVAPGAVPWCAIRGSDDRRLTPLHLAAWSAWDPRTVIATVAGGHFLATDPSFELWAVVEEFLTEALDTVDTAVPDDRP